MIYLTYPRPINGKVYNNEMIDAEDFAKFFGINIPNGKSVVFAFNKTKIKRDEDGAREVYPEARLMQPRYNGVFGGHSLTVRYATSVVQKESGNGFVNTYYPDRIEHKGKSHTLNLPENRELAIFTASMPQCESSPFANSSPDFKIRDNERTAKTKIDDLRLRTDLQAEILKETDIHKLRAFASGVRVNGKGVAVNAEITLPELHILLVDLLNANLADFEVQWREKRSLTDVRGTISTLIADGIFVVEGGGNGTQTVRFRHDVENGRSLIVVPQGEQVLDVLISQAHRENNYNQWVAAVNAYYRGQEVESSGMKIEEVLAVTPTSEMSPAQLVRTAIQKNIIAFDRTDKKVKFLKKDGTFFDNFFATLFSKIENLNEWESEFAAAVAVNKPILSKLRNAVKDGGFVSSKEKETTDAGNIQDSQQEV